MTAETFTGHYYTCRGELHYPKKKVLVTGACGLIGSAICDHLSKTHDVKKCDILLKGGNLLLTDNYDVVIDCARYATMDEQRLILERTLHTMKDQGHGKVILFSSIYGHKAPDFGMYKGTEIQETPIEYAIWKGGTEQATRWLAQKLKPYGVQVNCIAPGGVINGHSETFQEEYITSGGVGMIEVKNLMPVIDALLHEDNAVNGQVITVDKGWTL